MFEPLLERIARAFDREKLQYMVIGGQAVLLHGEPRLTRDIDVTVGAGLDELARVLAAARGAGLEPLVDPDTFTRKTMVLPCRDPGTSIRVDMILSFSDYERAALARAKEVRLGVTLVRFAAVEDLIIAKVVAGRPRDLDDVASILLKNPNRDEAWILRWLGELEAALAEPFVARYREIVSRDRGRSCPD